jgi:hypothetical protein
MPVPTPPGTLPSDAQSSPYDVGRAPSWGSDGTVETIRDLLSMLPSMRIYGDTFRNPQATSILPGGILTVGQHVSISAKTNQNPDLWFAWGSGDGIARAGTRIQAVIGPLGADKWRAGLRTPLGQLAIIAPNVMGNDVEYIVSTARSVIVTFEPGGFWNSTITVDINKVDMSTVDGPVRISGQSGIYVQFKPFPLLALAAVVAVIAISPIPDDALIPALLEGGRRALESAIP